MKKPIIADETFPFDERFHSPADFGQISAHGCAAAATIAVDARAGLLDHLLAAIKWVFLYLPGTAVLHVIPFGFALGLFYEGEPQVEMLIGSLAFGIFAVFMVMMGIGKLSDLRYLKVPAGIISVSTLAAVVYAATAAFVPGDFFAAFVQISFLLSPAFGYAVKRHTDSTRQTC